MAAKPKFPAKVSIPIPIPIPVTDTAHGGYVQGDALPVPEVIEKDSESVWALWSDAIRGTIDKDLATQPATLMMGLHELPKVTDA